MGISAPFFLFIDVFAGSLDFPRFYPCLVRLRAAAGAKIGPSPSPGSRAVPDAPTSFLAARWRGNDGPASNAATARFSRRSPEHTVMRPQACGACRASIASGASGNPQGRAAPRAAAPRMTVAHMLLAPAISDPHPMQSLCTLRDHCRQWPRNTRYQADATPSLGPDLHRLDRTSLRLAHLFDHLVSAQQNRCRHIEAELPLFVNRSDASPIYPGSLSSQVTTGLKVPKERIIACTRACPQSKRLRDSFKEGRHRPSSKAY